MAEEGKKGVKDDAEMFAFFELFEKLAEHPDRLTGNEEQELLWKYNIKI